MARRTTAVVENPPHESGPPLFDGAPPGELAPEISDYLEANATMFTDESMARIRKGLHTKLSEIYAVVGRIPKTGTAPASMGGFSFVEASNVADVIRAELSARKITMMPTDIDMVQRQTKNGTPLINLKVTWTFVDGESGEAHTITSMGEGADSSDKAAPKAQTNAMKYALLMAFLVPTGDDPERFDTESGGASQINITSSAIPGIKPGGRQGQITEKQYDLIRERARELQLDPLQMKQVVEHALSTEEEPYGVTSWPAGGSLDEQRDAILEAITKLSFDQAAAVLTELHGSEPDPGA
jgi:hypothetical protein